MCYHTESDNTVGKRKYHFNRRTQCFAFFPRKTCLLHLAFPRISHT
ncbi:hypothetical protein V1477_010167 [Vespula maculifrons]|uniref:Uncharacterized protein n=1 Tax=Vespula maculifrons TaxID=7453 RepID=A0ABD2C7S8_VESMC